MITTIDKLMAQQGWEIGKEYKVDAWIGISRIRHATAVQPYNSTTIIITFEELIDREYLKCGVENRGKEIDILDYKSEDLIYAESMDEMKADCAILTRIISENRKDAIDRTVSKILSYVDALVSVTKGMDWDVESTLRKKLKSDGYKEFNELIVHRLGYTRDSDIFSEDSLYDMVRVYHNRGFVFRDVDNGSIDTRVNLDNATSVLTGLNHDGKSAVAVNMANGNTYYIYEDADKTLYEALSRLYE